MSLDNKRSPRSYGLWRLWGDCNPHVPLPELREAIDGIACRRHFLENAPADIAPGGAWHLHVETFKAELDGDADRLAMLEQQQANALAAMSAGFSVR